MDRWNIAPDGEILGMYQRPPNTAELIYIPFSNAAHFRTSTEKNNPEGLSVMRSAFEPFTFAKTLRRTEAIGVERDLAGIPILQVKENASLDLWNEKDPNAAATLARCEQIVRLIRQDKFHGVVLPAQFELSIINSPGTRPVDADKVITRYENRCALALASDVLLLGSNRAGSFAMAKTKLSLMKVALEGFADRVEDEFNSRLIPRLCLLNLIPEELFPTMSFGPVGIVDSKELAAFVKVLTDAEALDISQSDEDYLREDSGMPKKIK